MKKLDRYMKECNLVFTDTVDRLEFCRVDFDIDKIEVNYNDSISLLHLVSSFNKLYLSFKKEYDNLEKLDLGKSIEVLRFSKFDYNKDNYRNLTIYIDEPTITKHGNTILYITEINNEIKPFVTNDRNPFDKNYYREDIKLNNDIAKKYLDLFEKYSLLLNTYNYLKNSQIFGDGINCIFTVIDNYNSNLLEGLNKFQISFGSAYFNTQYFVELLINLGDNFGIDYNSGKLIIDGEDTLIEKKDYDKILANIYVNKKYTKERTK